MYKSDNPLFRSLTDHEETQFRQWARENYKMGDAINPIWHPVVVDECQRMIAESALAGYSY